MPRLQPFIGWRFNPARAGPLAGVVTPPYDVITADGRRDFAALSPYNMVHLILPEPDGDLDGPAAAAASLRRWRAGQVLIPDRRPSVTLHRQEWTEPDGQVHRRTGLIAALPFPEAGSDAVRPHELTLEGPRSDRLRLTLATRAHLSPVFLLAVDPEGRLDALLTGAVDRLPGARFEDRDGARHRVAPADEPGFLAAIDRLSADSPLLIADGHHRYESAQSAHTRLRDELGASDPVVVESGRMLVEVVSLSSPGLRIMAYHRLVPKLRSPDPELFTRLAARPGACCIALPEEADAAGRLLTTELSRRDPGTVALLLAGRAEAIVVQLAPAPDAPEPLRGLDVTRVHRGLLRDLLGIGDDEISHGGRLRFTRDAGEAIGAVRRGEAQVAILLKPTPLGDLVRVTAAGLRMPQKATYFHPKVPAGVVIHPFD
jgi:uncharacterized protein (DUF1015 family)